MRRTDQTHRTGLEDIDIDETDSGALPVLVTQAQAWVHITILTETLEITYARMGVARFRF